MIKKIEIDLKDEFNPNDRVLIKDGDWLNLMKKLNEIIEEINKIVKLDEEPIKPATPSEITGNFIG